MKKRVVLLHGLLGAPRNWREFITRVTNVLPHIEIETPALRFHGDNIDPKANTRLESSLGTTMGPALDDGGHGGGVSPLEAAADDIAASLDGKIVNAVIGHSMGGKVGLVFAKRHAEMIVHDGRGQLWVLDAEPWRPRSERDNGDGDGTSGSGRNTATETPRILACVRRFMREHALPPADAVSSTSLKSHVDRAQLKAYAEAEGFSPAIVNWLTSTALKRTQSNKMAFELNFDVDGCEALYRDYCTTDVEDVLRFGPMSSSSSSSIRRFHVRGDRSDRIDAEGAARLDTMASASGGAMEAFELRNAGHWVQHDNLPGLLEIMLPRLAAL